MADRIFGWSYPPGVSSLPWDNEGPCEICGGMPDDDCICPECPECFCFGDPDCYKNHGLVLSQEQIDQLAAKEIEWAKEADEMSTYYGCEDDSIFNEEATR